MGLVSANAGECEHTSSIVHSKWEVYVGKNPLRSGGLSPEPSLPNKSLNDNNY